MMYVQKYLEWCNTPLKGSTRKASEGTPFFTTAYRGQANTKWTLIPKLARYGTGIEQGTGALRMFEEYIWQTWQDHIGGEEHRDVGCNLRELARAQHYGLATRATDWTRNPLIALWFAITKEPSEVGVVFRTHIDEQTRENKEFNTFEDLEEDTWYLPEGKNTPLRARVQGSILLVHSDPRKTNPKYTQDYYEISADDKIRLERELRFLNIDAKSVFPDRGKDAIAMFANRVPMWFFNIENLQT